MRIRVIFFGPTADIVGKRSEDLDVVEDVTAGKVLGELRSRFSVLENHKLHISINQEYAQGDSIVRSGDEIAVFTAVSGG